MCTHVCMNVEYNIVFINNNLLIRQRYEYSFSKTDSATKLVKSNGVLDKKI